MVLGLIARSRASSRTRRHHLARAEHAAGDGKFHLPHDLIVDRQAVVRIDVEEHGSRALVYYRASTVHQRPIVVKRSPVQHPD